MTVTVHALDAAVGAEITGVGARQLLADEDLPGIVRDALEQHGVLVFRGLDLPPETQVAFCSRLGDIDTEPGHHPVEGIYRVTLDPAKNSSAGYLRGTFDWHIDGCMPVNGAPPQKATVLSAKAVAGNGGQTEFASTYRAYEDLSTQEKTALGAMRVVHSLEASQRFAHPDPSPEQLASWRRRPTHEHPLVWTHESGRRSLVIGVMADHVVGMAADESRALLDDLLDRCTAPGRVYRHEWTVGDTVIWDNRGVVHRVVPYAADSRREMLRTTVLGDEHIR